VQLQLKLFCQTVAPHVGAWIETGPPIYEGQTPLVAPHVGAWIETLSDSNWEMSACVAPHVGAWIETMADMKDFPVHMPSPLT